MARGGNFSRNARVKGTVRIRRAPALNEMHGANVIFLGSPWMNGALARLAAVRPPMYNTNDGRILVPNPLPGEPSQYENVKDPGQRADSLLLCAFQRMPGMDEGHKIVSSAGVGTWATSRWVWIM